MSEKNNNERIGLVWLLLGVLLWGGAAHAAWLENEPITVVQPNGDTLHLLASGDEYFNYLHDANGYTIMQHPQNGYYVYAEKRYGSLMPTNFIVGNTNPVSKGLLPHALISPEEWLQRRKAWEVADERPVNRDMIPNHGTLNNISIFIRFSDDEEFINSYSSIDNMFNDETENAVSMINYFRSASYNAITIHTYFYPGHNGETIISYQDSFPRSYYQVYNEVTNPNGYQTEDQSREREFALLERAVNHVNNNSPVPTDLDIDYDDDGYVDNICFIIRGNVEGWNSLLWPHKWTLYDRTVRINGKRVYTFNFQLADATEHFNTSTMCHEMNHTLGSPDLYHYSYSGPTPVGPWDLMQSNAMPPQHCGAYMKMKYGHWIDDIPEITQVGTYTLNPISSLTPENVAYKVATDDPNQFYVLEYRNTATPFESALPGSGLLIYRIDTRFGGNKDYDPLNGIYDEVYIFRPDGTFSEDGNLENACFSANVDRTEFSQLTNPYPFFSEGGLDSKFCIYDISEAGNTISFSYTNLYNIEVSAFPEQAGTVSGGGLFTEGSVCTVTATPNPGFAFMGWYGNALGTMLYSRQPEYTFTVTRDRHLYAKFILQNYDITTSCSPANGGTVTGDGSYMAGSTVTLTATANTGYVFSCWTEDGEVVSSQPTYSFTALSNRHVVANFMNLSFSIGDVITNPDGSKGVVFYINPTYTGGCMVALEDVSTDCKWGNSGDVTFLRNYTWTRNECQLSDLDGYANTAVLRDYQPTNDNYASGIVNYANGWYVPSAGQLRKLFGALPFIELSISSAGGTLLAENANYWSSTEHTESNAWTASFEMVSASKASNYRVRAVHDFSVNNTMRVVARTNDTELGSVTGTGFYANGATVTVTATPSGDNLFRGWTEAGHLVSLNPTYTFTANANRNLVANFAIRGGVGTLVTNPDGSQGVLFHLNEDGTEGWMVALEDASEGCQWGPDSDVSIMCDRAWNDQKVLRDQDGFYNTWLIRISQGTDNGYAASVVDFDNGWYLPSSGQLRKLYAELPMIEETLIKAGGSILTDGKYWSSTEYSSSYVSTPGFEISYTSKTSNCKVRAIRNYHPAGDNVVLVAANDATMGTVSVSGSGVFALNESVTVNAIPNADYQFDHWTENGATVSYDAAYQFTFTRSRSLEAHFVVPGSVGSVVTNADGSSGVVFYKEPSGNGCLIVALEDASEGCAWGVNEDILFLTNQNPGQSQYMLNDVNGYSNTQLIRQWQSNNPNYAAGKVDFDNGWYLPSAGELRKLYAALPLIEEAIVCAGGTLLSGNSYWSSSECSSSQAWSPSFEFTKSDKTSNLRVRAIRSMMPMMQISATVYPSNGGTVSGAGTYNYGETVTLIADANEGYSFINWTRNGNVVSTETTYSFTVTEAAEYVANFELNTYDITATANPTEGGTITGAGSYSHGTTATLTATANEGFVFANWKKDGQQVSTSTSYSFTVTEDADFVANFEALSTYTVTATANPATGGTVSGGGTYYEGATCNLMATANEGYTFINWTKNGQSVSTNLAYSFTVTENVSIVANFELNTYEVTATANPTEGGAVTGGGTYDYGTEVTLTATANEGFVFANWKKDGQQVSTSTSYSFTVTEDADFVANFEALSTYTVTVTANPTTGGTVSGGGTYYEGAICDLMATSLNGYTFINWTENDDEVSTEAAYGFTVTGDRTLVANFVATENDITQTTNFAQGWNWWSSYVEANNLLEQLENGLGTHGMTVKSQNGFVQYSPEYNVWYGITGFAINNEVCYMIQTDAARNVEITGTQANPTNHPITLATGWNWIGYPCSTHQSFTTAFAGIAPQDGDLVKSQAHGFASYMGDYGIWYGNLSDYGIDPGMGLMYLSNNNQTFSFTYPESRGDAPVGNDFIKNNHWNANYKAYPNNMTVIAVVELDDVELQGGNYELAAFANGECRGSVRLTYVAPLNRYLAFLTVAGDEASELRFQLYDAEAGTVETECLSTLQFETNAVVGSLETPCVIRFRSTTGLDEWTNSISVFPNPVASGEMLNIGLPDRDSGKVCVEIVNALGVIVETVCSPSVQTIAAPKVGGVYTLRIAVEGKGTCCRKLVVR